MEYKKCYVVPNNNSKGINGYFICELCNRRYHMNESDYFKLVSEHYDDPQHLARVKTEKLNVLIGIFNKLK